MSKADVNIFGTTYSFELIDSPDDYMFDHYADGYAEFDKKKITVLAKRTETRRVVIHELIHAFLYESGHRQKANDEDLVELLTEIAERIAFILKNQFDEVQNDERNISC